MIYALELRGDRAVVALCHVTTMRNAERIAEEGLQPLGDVRQRISAIASAFLREHGVTSYGLSEFLDELENSCESLPVLLRGRIYDPEDYCCFFRLARVASGVGHEKANTRFGGELETAIITYLCEKLSLPTPEEAGRGYVISRDEISAGDLPSSQSELASYLRSAAEIRIKGPVLAQNLVVLDHRPVEGVDFELLRRF